MGNLVLLIRIESEEWIYEEYVVEEEPSNTRSTIDTLWRKIVGLVPNVNWKLISKDCVGNARNMMVMADL